MSDSPLRVLLGSQLFWPAYSGAAIRFQRYAPGLRKRSVELEVVTIDRGDRPREDVVDGIPVHRIAGGIRGGLTNAAFFSTLASQSRISRPDIVQVMGTSPMAIPYFASIRRAGIPIVHPVSMVRKLSSNPLRRLEQRIHRRLSMSFVDCLVARHKLMKGYLRSLGGRKRIEIIPHGVDLERFRPADTTEAKHHLRRQLGLGPEAQVVIFIGGMSTRRMSARKGIHLLLEGWPQVLAERPEALLLLVGPTGSEHSNDGRFISQGPDRRIHAVGQVPNVEEFLRCADLLVLPSAQEGHPNAVVEAMASGVPCLLTPYIGLAKELGEPGRDYMLAPRESQPLAKAIVDLLGNTKLRSTIAISGRRRVEQHMNVNDTLDRYASLYRELAGIHSSVDADRPTSI